MERAGERGGVGGFLRGGWGCGQRLCLTAVRGLGGADPQEPTSPAVKQGNIHLPEGIESMELMDVEGRLTAWATPVGLRVGGGTGWQGYSERGTEGRTWDCST